MTIFGWMALFVVVGAYGGLPLIVRITARLGFHFEKLPSGDDIPDLIRARIDARISLLGAIGLRSGMWWVARSPGSSGMTMYGHTSIDPSGQIAACAMCNRTRGLPVTDCLELLTILIDEHTVHTTNSLDTFAIPIPAERKTVLPLSWLQDGPLLFEAHKKLVARVSRERGAEPRVLLPSVDYRSDSRIELWRFTEQTIRDQLEWLAQEGYLKARPDGGYRLTLRGAYVLTGRQMPPFKKRLRKRIDDDAHALLRELG